MVPGAQAPSHCWRESPRHGHQLLQHHIRDRAGAEAHDAGVEAEIAQGILEAEGIEAVVMADHYDTAYMEDVYEKERGGSGAPQTRQVSGMVITSNRNNSTGGEIMPPARPHPA